MWRHLFSRPVRSVLRTQLKNIQWHRPNSNCARDDPYDMSACYRQTNRDGIIRTSAFEPIEVPNMRVHEFVWKDLYKWQDHVALVDGETSAELTYAQLRDICAAVAVRLQRPDMRLQPQDCIAISLPNCPEYVIASLGAIEGGFVVSPVNPLYNSGELAAHIHRVDAKLFIIPVEIYPKVKKGLDMLDLDVPIVCVRQENTSEIPSGTIDFKHFMNTNDVDFCSLNTNDDISPSSTVVMPSSSGTTGLPKAVQLSHINITTNVRQILVPMPHLPLVLPTTESHQDVLPCVLPFFHIYGFILMLLLAKGVKLVTLRRFAPDTFLRALTMYKGSVLNVVPPIINYMGKSPLVESSHLENIRVVLCGAASMPGPELDVFMKKINRPEVHYTQGYGMTETCIVTINLQGSTKRESTGVLLPNIEIKVCEENSTDGIGKGLNETGELWIRGPNVMKGYFDAPEATANMINEDGWLKTGDAGHFDEQGYVFLTGRFKDLIKVKGFQVAAAELEEILLSHDDVADAAVVGMPDKRTGETPIAVVVLKAKGKVKEGDLIEMVAELVTEYKQLGDVVYVKQIPRNATGKILRAQIKADLKQHYSAKSSG